MGRLADNGASERGCDCGICVERAAQRAGTKTQQTRQQQPADVFLGEGTRRRRRRRAVVGGGSDVAGGLERPDRLLCAKKLPRNGGVPFAALSSAGPDPAPFGTPSVNASSAASTGSRPLSQHSPSQGLPLQTTTVQTHRAAPSPRRPAFHRRSLSSKLPRPQITLGFGPCTQQSTMNVAHGLSTGIA